MTDTKTTANDLDIIQHRVDLNGQRLTNGSKAENNNDLITKGEAVSILMESLPTFRVDNGILIAVYKEDGDE